MMARQFSTTLRSARAQQIETTIGTAPLFEIFTGAAPANCAAADSGTKLASITLPSDWVTESNGVLTKAGTWSVAASATGTAAHYRLKSSGGTVHEQGTVTATGGGGDATIDNTSITNGQTVTVATWVSTEGGA